MYQCECQTCGDTYIGETGPSLTERLTEHQKSVQKRDQKSALSQHQETTGHNMITSLQDDNINNLERENRDSHRKVLEAINIRLNRAKLYRNDGTELPNLYLPLLREGAGTGGSTN